MAKALIGHLPSDLHTSSRLAADNRRLRQRVAELEALVLRLKEENDALAAHHDELRELDHGLDHGTVPDAVRAMQPV